MNNLTIFLQCNDDMCATFVRDVSMRVSPHVELGSHCPTFPKCDGKVVLQVCLKKFMIKGIEVDSVPPL